KEKVCLALQNVFTSTKIFVEDDLVGATRAVGRGVSGVVAILGTGSNAALCVEGEIVRRIPSNGIWFGDEGSGASLGKELIKAYLNDDLPIDLKNAFEENYSERRAEILENVYVKPFPNRYLASFAPFVRRQLHHPFLQVLVRENFQKFFEFVLRKLSIAASHRSFYFVGSIAHFFSEKLQEVADAQGIRIVRIMDQPIVGLGHYHLHEPTD
ncbi:MAG: N-acetylglucosamine kinase, partial [Flammeovirgaceae bacterium]|nr:N-acetylglucosamine kinase [Flammeovirgaceae bacterium]MDW8288908.1 N-acetylglucosamine kinase [Flammeovirgaceae bacterium]